jgi:cysteine desulfuration protein SufE
MPNDTAADTVAEREQEIIDEFSLFDDWIGRYEYLIEMGDDIPKIADEDKTEDHYIHGCQSDVWIRSDYDDERGVLCFRGDSNAKITRGLAALIIRVLNEQPPEAVEEADFEFLDTIGLREHLTSQRNNGLESMVDAMRHRAREHGA